jgi:hypothetical protein
LNILSNLDSEDKLKARTAWSLLSNFWDSKFHFNLVPVKKGEFKLLYNKMEFTRSLGKQIKPKGSVQGQQHRRWLLVLVRDLYY